MTDNNIPRYRYTAVFRSVISQHRQLLQKTAKIARTNTINHYLQLRFQQYRLTALIKHCSDFLYPIKVKQDAQLSQRDRAAACVIVFAKSRSLELGNNILRTL